MEARRPEARAAMECAAPAAIGLVDVVRRAGLPPGRHCRATLRAPSAPERSERARFAREQSVPRSAAAVHPGDGLRLSLHELRGTTADRRMVEANLARRVS